MSKKPQKIQFNGGELSPWLMGRVDIAKFDKTALLCRNFIPLTEGALKRRGGTRFVAQTPEDDDVTLRIVPNPIDAIVMINNENTDTMTVSRGDTVTYEVRARYYKTVSGKVSLTQSMVLNIVLVSLVETCYLSITPVPVDATVKIGGYERKLYFGKKNETVDYVVYKDGYQMKSGTVLLNESKSITVSLEEEEVVVSEYGDWGDPVAFISCTAYGCIEPQLKCFLIQFENGYLPILFNSNKVAPSASDIDESLFVYTHDNGYDSYLLDGNHTKRLGVIKRQKYGIYYYDLDGTLLVAYDYASMTFMGWQVDDEREYAATYKRYDGSVSGSLIKVYYKGEQVFLMRGRNNG